MNNIMKSYRKLPYTWRHKLAMIRLEKQFTGKVSVRILLHDMDKILMYAFVPFLGPKRVHDLHRKLMPHHHFMSDVSDAVIKEMIIDWESARYTKKDKPETAREYCLNVRPYLFDRMEPHLDQWNI